MTNPIPLVPRTHWKQILQGFEITGVAVRDHATLQLLARKAVTPDEGSPFAGWGATAAKAGRKVAKASGEAGAKAAKEAAEKAAKAEKEAAEKAAKEKGGRPRAKVPAPSTIYARAMARDHIVVVPTARRASRPMTARIRTICQRMTSALFREMMGQQYKWTLPTTG